MELATRPAWWARLAWCALVATAVAGAAWLRHHWVEAQGLGALCAQSPGLWPCAPRQFVIDSFLHHKLGGLALGLGSVALYGAWRASAPVKATQFAAVWLLSVCGAMAAAAGLVLYDADLSALGFVISALACARATQAAGAPAR